MFVTAVIAGGINSVAGGGSLLTFPTLIWLGVPSINANATNTVAVWPGTLGSVWAYRGELKGAAAAEILDTLTWAVRERRTDLEIRLYRGRVLKLLGKLEEAIRDFSVVASMDDQNLEAVREVRLHRAREEQKASASGFFGALFKS